MEQAPKLNADPEDDLARIAAEATNDATPEKALHESSETRKARLDRAKPKQGE